MATSINRIVREATIRFKMADKPRHETPSGMEPYDLGGENDLGALSPRQQENLNKFKVQTRIQNEAYLRDHPEVECLLASFLSMYAIKYLNPGPAYRQRDMDGLTGVGFDWLAFCERVGGSSRGGASACEAFGHHINPYYDVLINRPENIREFASAFFTRSGLPDSLRKQLRERQYKMHQNTFLKSM